MSFGYNPLTGNSITPMMPILGNVANGTNFLPQLAAATAMQQLSGPPGLLQSMAGINDSPLEFNFKKNQPLGAGPMELETDRDQDNHSMGRSRLGKSAADERNDDLVNNSPLDSPNKSLNSNYGQNDILYNGIMGMPQSLMMMPTSMINMMDPSMIGLQQYPLMGQLNEAAAAAMQQNRNAENGSAANVIGTKDMIKCKSCTLLPPNPNGPPATTRERPPGCRTVFVGGLPANATEDIIREVFERCGEISTLRLSKKYFCHIRFTYESCVDSAIFLSGYSIRIGNNMDTANTGRLHVDFAQARDDQYEWECKQRQLQREQRHRERMERDRQRNLSPPPIVHYTDHEASVLSEKLKQDDQFNKAVQVLTTWLERGDCNKKNSNTFYSMLQSSNSHVRRLQTERSTYEEELDKAKRQYKKQMQSISGQFTQIEKVFGAASHKKVWDHFTKAQRKNINIWKKQSTELRCIQLDDLQDGDEMEMSDDDRDSTKNCKRMRTHSQSLQVENENLKTELAACKTDADMVKSMLEFDTDVKEQQIKVLQETIRNLQTQLLENNTKEKEFNTKISNLETKLKQANVKELLLKTKIVEAGTKNPSTSAKSSEVDDNEIIDVDDDDDDDDDKSSDDGKTITKTITTATATLHQFQQPVIPPTVIAPPPTFKALDCDEARIIGLVSTFLVVHPFGASLDYIYSYVQRVAPALRPKELEEILSRYQAIFSEEVTGVGVKIERKWKFCGFNSVNATE